MIHRNSTGSEPLYEDDASSSSSSSDSCIDDIGGNQDISNETKTNKDLSHTSPSDDGAVKPVLAEKETKHLRYWRIVLVVVLVSVATAVCTGTYLFVLDESNSDYKLSVRKVVDHNVIRCLLTFRCDPQTFS